MRKLWVLLWPAGLLAGLLALRVAATEPGLSLMARSPVTVGIGLGAGWAAITIGLLAWRRGSPTGPLLVAAGLAWFVVELGNPASGSSVAFTAGLLGAALCPPVVAHLVLSYPGGRLGSTAERLAVGIAYLTNAIGLGVLATLTFDPARELCAFCPDNLLALAADPAAHATIETIGMALLVGWASLVALLIGRRLLRSSRTVRRLHAPVLVPGTLFMAAAAGGAVQRLAVGGTADDVQVGLWLVEAIGLIGIAVGVAYAWVRARWTRTRVAQLVVEFGRSPAPGGLAAMLSSVLDDLLLRLAYPLEGARYVDAGGRDVQVSVEPGRAVTQVTRSGATHAVLDHRADLLDDPARIEDVMVTSRLALESERLGAELAAQLKDLRDSRVRIVTAADAERRRLEGDLHDGAQQRLVSLSMALRIAGRELASAGDRSAGERLDAAQSELRAAIDDVRELAHNLYPAVLTDEGLAAAIEGLRESAAIPIQLGEIAEGRMDPQVEAAAYFVVAGAAAWTTVQGMTVTIQRVADQLVVEVGAEGLAGDVIDLQDRVGALDGVVRIDTADGSVLIRAEIPCAS